MLFVFPVGLMILFGCTKSGFPWRTSMLMTYSKDRTRISCVGLQLLPCSSESHCLASFSPLVEFLPKRHLTGILTGYLLVWGTLDAVSPPILMGLSVVFMLQHSQAWARKMPDFSLLLQSWASGDTGRVARARRLKWIFQAHV